MNFIVDFRFLEPNPGTAACCIKVEHFLQGLQLSVVHVGCVQNDVSQCRHLECIFVPFAFSYVEATVVLLRALNFRNPDDLEIAVCKSRRAVTLEAASAS